MSLKDLSRNEANRRASKSRNQAAFSRQSFHGAPAAAAPYRSIRERLSLIGLELVDGERRLQASFEVSREALVWVDGKNGILTLNADESISFKESTFTGTPCMPVCVLQRI